MKNHTICDMINLLEREFRNPLLEREIRLMPALDALNAYFGNSARAELASHWWRLASDVPFRGEQSMLHMVHPCLSFSQEFKNVHMNEEGSVDRVIEMIS